jgi:hypothetical protein
MSRVGIESNDYNLFVEPTITTCLWNRRRTSMDRPHRPCRNDTAPTTMRPTGRQGRASSPRRPRLTAAANGQANRCDPGRTPEHRDPSNPGVHAREASPTVNANTAGSAGAARSSVS